MTNYTGHEALRHDVAALNEAMCDLRRMLNELESRYRYNAEPLTERLVRQTICRINNLYLEAFHEVLSLDACFKD